MTLFARSTYSIDLSVLSRTWHGKLAGSLSDNLPTATGFYLHSTVRCAYNNAYMKYNNREANYISFVCILE